MIKTEFSFFQIVMKFLSGCSIKLGQPSFGKVLKFNTIYLSVTASEFIRSVFVWNLLSSKVGLIYFDSSVKWFGRFIPVGNFLSQFVKDTCHQLQQNTAEHFR